MLTRVLQEAVFSFKLLVKIWEGKYLCVVILRLGLSGFFPDVQNPVFLAHFQS